MTNIHALIEQFLQQQTVALPGNYPDGEAITKAGVVPFMRQPDYRFYLMKPKAKRPDLGDPGFQFAKGTRQYFDETRGWLDIRSKPIIGRKETLAATALREGIEELGLKLANIATLYELGPYDFFSATTGETKTMWLFAAEIKSIEDFLPTTEIAASTDARQWLTCGEFPVVGRPDQHYILTDIESRLKRHFQE